MEMTSQAAASYQLHQVIPAENILVQPATPPTAAQLMVQHLPPTSEQPGTSGAITRKTPSGDQGDQYRLKYLALKKKCQGIQLGNDKLLNRLYYVRKAVRKLTRERRFLMSKLDEFGDDYRSAQLPVPIEDESVLSLLSSGSTLPATYSPPKEHSPSSGTKRSASPTGTGDKSDTIKPPLVVKPPSVSPAGTKRRRSSAQTRGDKEKDPNAPKKPANAFLMFCQQERLSVLEEYSKENPQGEMSHQDLTKELAKKWNDLTADEKKLYYTMYEQDKRRYEREMRQYKMSESKTIKTTLPTNMTTTTTTSSTASATINTTAPATVATITKPSAVALPAAITLPSVSSQPMTNPIITAPSVIQTPVTGVVVKQEPLGNNNNNTVMKSSLGAKPATPVQVTVNAPRTLPIPLPATTITLSKPVVPTTAAAQPHVTLTTSPASAPIIQGATSYIKLSLGPALTLPSNTSVVAPPKTTSGLATPPKSGIPITLATKNGGQAALTTKSSRQTAVVTKIGGQATMVTKSSGQAAMLSKIGGQASMGTKISVQSAVTTKTGGQATTATKPTSGQSSIVTKTSGQSVVGTKGSGHTGASIKIGGQSTIATKPGLQTVTTAKTSGQVTIGTRTGVQATMASKVSGQATVTSRLSGQGLTIGGQGMSAAAVLSRLAAPGGGRISGSGLSISTTVPSRVAPTSMQHTAGTAPQVNVVKETKKLLTGQKPSTGTQGTSVIKKEPLAKADDDPYHFDD